MTERTRLEIGRRDPLVMTLLVRDEVDVVEQNLRFHLARGVDHVVALDNASSDGTKEILERFAREGYVTLLHEPSDDYRQQAWVQRLVEVARERFGAAWILPNDADEFWRPPDCRDRTKGDLRRTLRRATSRLVVCERVNMLAAWPDLEGAPWQDTLIWRPAIGPRPPGGQRLESGAPVLHPLFFYRLPRKILVHTEGLVSIAKGAHAATFARSELGCDVGIEVYHFPVRASEEFERSVRRIYRATVPRDDRPAGTSSKYLRWGAMLKRSAPFTRVLSDALPSRTRSTLYRSVCLLRRDTRMRDDLAELDSQGTAGRLSAEGKRHESVPAAEEPSDPSAAQND